MAYVIFRTLHLLGSTVLFGGGLAMGYFLWMAVRSRDTQTIANTLQHVIRAEWWFIVPAVAIQPLTGILLMNFLGYSQQSDWFRSVMGVYAVLGLVWLPVVIIQVRLRKLALVMEAEPEARHEFTSALRWWAAFSIAMYVLAIALIYLMVAKPGL